MLDGDGRVNRTPEKEVCFVKDCPGQIYDGLKVNFRVSDSGGTYSYIDVQGAHRTVRALSSLHFHRAKVINCLPGRASEHPFATKV